MAEPSRPENGACVPILERDGYAVLEGVFPPEVVDDILRGLTAALAAPKEGAALLYSQEGNIYAARNVLSLWPHTATVWRRSPLPETLGAVLGPAYGLVRALYFDKPPQRN